MYRPGVSTDNVHCGIMMSVLHVHSGAICFLFPLQFNELNDITKFTKPPF